MERLVWLGPVRHIGGYGEVARGFLRGLLACGADVVAVDTHGPSGDLDARALDPLAEALAGAVQPKGRSCVYHSAPGEFRRLLELHPMDGAERRIACTISETDRLPPDAVADLAPFDEVWVPATFHRETFSISGVPREKLRVVPYGVDTELYRPAPRSAGPDGAPFRFLYCFQLGWRKGFDLLLEAYLTEFRRDEPVELVLKLLGSTAQDPGRAALVTSIAERVDFFDPELPRVRVIEDDLGLDGMVELYRCADLYLSTDRANGWGMPCLEAMACGTPAGAIDWSGSTEFMHEGNALLIPPGPLVPLDPRLSEANPFYRDQRWPAIEVGELRGILRRAWREPETLRTRAAAALEEVQSRFSLEAAARQLLERNRRSYAPRPGLVGKVLQGIGLQRPEALVAGARSRLLLCLFGPQEQSWREPLRRYLERFGADDDVSLCLWVDAQSDAELAGLAAEVQQEIAAAESTDPPDICLVVAPRDHVPWERVEVEKDFAPA